jgi:hypothetical protein
MACHDRPETHERRCIFTVFKRWRYPATLATAIGIAFPALAVASAGSNGAATKKKSSRAVAARAHGRYVLNRPARRLHDTITVQVHRIRAAQKRRHRHRFAKLPGGISRSTLNAIAACESGGDPHAVSAGGTYRGKYQFDYGTWASVGGHGDPAAASEREQDYRAALLYVRSGSNPWPVCG